LPKNAQFYTIHLTFNRGCFETIWIENTPGSLGVNPSLCIGPFISTNLKCTKPRSGENRRLVYCEPMLFENNRLDSKSTGKKSVKILRKSLNIVKIEANNWNRYSKNRLIMGMEGY
jgi:hypothetical protein